MITGHAQEGGSVSELNGSKNVPRRQLVNKLNFINFQDETVVAHFRHDVYDSGVSLRVKPLPCAGELLECVVADQAQLAQIMKSYSFDYLLIPDGKKYFLVFAAAFTLDGNIIRFHLPLSGREFKDRKIERHAGRDIIACFTQNGARFGGALADFTPIAVRVEGNVEPPQSLHWINPELPVNLHFYSGDRLLYSGESGIYLRSGTGDTVSFVLTMDARPVQRFKEKKYRSELQQLVPSPNILFEHPLTGKTINLKITGLSGSGCFVEECEDSSVLLTGMLIPELQLSFAHGLKIPCTAQVVSRSCCGDAGGEVVVSCGLVFLDMDLHGHVKLMSILHQAANKNAYLCTEVDMDDLWDFFFETGFIYPEKYVFFQADKDEIKNTYTRLYGDNPHIARHFTYRNRGIILGHLAMVRFYENSWLIHHHAARKSASLKAGLTVLSQISQYINELHYQYFAHLRYVYCYFRPENKFPNRVFGNFARQLNDSRGCSLDKFAYFHYHVAKDTDVIADNPWDIREAVKADFDELGRYYGFVSGGLMIDACDMRGDMTGHRILAAEYEKLGFRKEQYRFALTREGTLQALAILNVTDAGFNMANLTNCATLIVLDEDLPVEALNMFLQRVSASFSSHEMPVLLYPFSYAENNAYPFEKSYLLWILSMDFSDEYFKFCDTLFKGGGKPA